MGISLHTSKQRQSLTLGLKEKSGVSKHSAPGRSICYYSRTAIWAKDAEPDERQSKENVTLKYMLIWLLEHTEELYHFAVLPLQTVAQELSDLLSQHLWKTKWIPEYNSHTVVEEFKTTLTIKIIQSRCFSWNIFISPLRSTNPAFSCFTLYWSTKSLIGV